MNIGSFIFLLFGQLPQLDLWDTHPSGDRMRAMFTFYAASKGGLGWVGAWLYHGLGPASTSYFGLFMAR